MPLDPTIPLSFRPPPIAIANPLEQFGQVLSLKNLMTQGEMHGLELKQAQMAFQERQNLAKLFAGLSNPQTAPALPVSPEQPAPSQYEEPQLMGPAGLPSPVTPAPGSAMPIGATPAAVAPVAPARASFPSLGQIVSAAPMTGLGVFKTFHEAQKAEIENQIKQTELGQKQWEARGSAAQAVLDAPDPKAAFAPAVWDLVKRGALTDTEARQLIDRGFNADELHRFASTAQDVSKQAETKLTNLKAQGEGWKNFEEGLKGVSDQPGFERLLSRTDPAIQQIVGPTFDPKMKIALGVPLVEQPKLFREQAQSNAMRAVQAFQQGPDAYANFLSGLPSDQQDLFRNPKSEIDIRQRSLDPEKFITTERTVRQEAFNQAANLREGFTKASEPYRNIRDAYTRFQAAASSPPGGIRDIGLTYAFMKLVDPGSIVREGQAATVENASGVPAWARNVWNKLLTGESLPEESRKQILAQVEKIYGNATKDQQALESYYTERAKRFKLDPQDVIVPLGSTAATPAEPGGGKTGTGGENTPSTPALGELVPAGTVREGPNGQMYMSKGGSRKDPKNWFPVTKGSGGSWDPVVQ